MTTLQIGSRILGEGHPVFVVAELSANHGANRDIALRTVEAAAKCGADAIKLQTYTPDTLTLHSDSEHFVVRTKNEWAGRTLYDLYAEAMTPWEWHAELKAAAESLGLVFFSTPFDVTAVEYLESLGTVVHKVASFELTDLTLVEHVARRGHPMILSTGMATLGEIEEAVSACRAVGNEQLALLRCVSAYPARPEAMGLASLRALASFGTVVGLSDHTRDATAAITAVALGAKLVEKHFILDRSVGGPDAFFSLEPAEFTQLVRSVHDAERAVGVPRFGPSADEISSLRFRRSLFVATHVAKGDVLTCDHVRSVRPAAGILPKHLPDVLGRVATTDLEAATPLGWDHVGERPAARVQLRVATQGDSALLLEWRNDELTRGMSKSTAAVTPEEHARWLDSALQPGGARALFVATLGDAVVGQVRLDREGTTTEVSLTLAPAQRGKGLAVELLRAAESQAKQHGIRTFWATIRVENARSVAAFKRAGFYGFHKRVEANDSFWICERKISDAALGDG